jgi:hypothetical protein
MRNANHRIARPDGIEDFRGGGKKRNDAHQSEFSFPFGATQSGGISI